MKKYAPRILFLFILLIGLSLRAELLWIYPQITDSDILNNKILDRCVEVLHRNNIRVRVVSRFINAVSVDEDASVIEQLLSELPSLKAVVPVGVYRKSITNAKPAVSADYIPWREMIQADVIISSGLSGKRIRLGLIDTGFNLRNRIFSRINVIAQRDFIQNDTVTQNQTGDAVTQDYHGTETLGLIAANDETYPGIAPDCDFYLAKSEIVDEEIRQEEDLWIAALEWMDSMKVQIVSSSLGYFDFDDGFSYNYSHLDGISTAISAAATEAVKRGMIITASAGNEGNNQWYYITPPSDGIGVICVGSVDMNGEVSAFSSRGPSFDGRIKPDLVAPGNGIPIAKVHHDSGFTVGVGTSYATPQIAGACALLLEAFPYKTPTEILSALCSTAGNSQNPDNGQGWGVIRIYDAYLSLLSANSTNYYINVINKNNSLYFNIPETGYQNSTEMQIYNILGQQVTSFRMTNLDNGLNYEWHNPGLASGFYVASVQVNRVHVQQKFIRIR